MLVKQYLEVSQGFWSDETKLNSLGRTPSTTSRSALHLLIPSLQCRVVVAGTERLVGVRRRMNATKYRDVPEENLLQRPETGLMVCLSALQ